MEIDLRCKKCGRWLGKATSNTDDLTIKCGNCKNNNVYNITFTSTINGAVCYDRDRTDLSEQPAKVNSKTAEPHRQNVRRYKVHE